MAPPGEELDRAWSQLLEGTAQRRPSDSDLAKGDSHACTGTLIRISEEEMSHLERDSVISLQSGGYAAGLGVGHDLHCLVG